MHQNIIEAVIARFGGGTMGMIKLGFLLGVTTQRVYQIRQDGVVKKPEHAEKLANETGWPFRAFLLKRAWDPTLPDGGIEADAQDRDPATARSTPSSSREMMGTGTTGAMRQRMEGTLPA